MLDSYPPILTTEEVASILRLSERTVIKFAKEGTIPAMKVGGQFRFSRDKLIEWIDAQMNGKNFDEWESLPRWHGGIAELLSSETVLTGFSAVNEEEAIRKLCEHAATMGRTRDSDELFNLVLQREKQWSTCMGHGLAFPHPRAVDASLVPEYVLLLAVSPEGVPFKGGEESVNIIGFFAIPNLQLHLKILASLTNLLSDASVREDIIAVDSAEKIIEIISKAEGKQDEREL
ncbi:PTS sugar transporter subunit IIA [Spirochaetia bacterium 38H-sp]|uniref:PTS sugar transporter subunit IIA n=1 Tax=Rarispira pelagica TaxID=3141764 RepID=A0ABU9U8Y6_9SPIR